MSNLKNLVAQAIGGALGFRPGDKPCQSVDGGIHCLKPARHVEEPNNEAHGALGGRTWLGGVDSEHSRRLS
jgi:hypothetical protein